MAKEFNLDPPTYDDPHADVKIPPDIAAAGVKAQHVLFCAMAGIDALLGRDYSKKNPHLMTAQIRVIENLMSGRGHERESRP